MSEPSEIRPSEIRARAAQLPEGDVIRILLEQHARIRELFTDVTGAVGEHKQHAFDELRALLAVHETAEEMVLRPMSAEAAGEAVAEARNREEAEANEVLKDLERLDVGSLAFDQKLAELRTAVEAHAEAEESQEFPRILSTYDERRRAVMGTQIRVAEKIAPTHPHPSTAGSTAAQYVVGPFVSLVDRARDAIKAARR